MLFIVFSQSCTVLRHMRVQVVIGRSGPTPHAKVQSRRNSPPRSQHDLSLLVSCGPTSCPDPVCVFRCLLLLLGFQLSGRVGELDVQLGGALDDQLN